MKKNKKNKRGLKVDLNVFRVLNRLWQLEQAVCTLNNSSEVQAVMQRTDRLVYATSAEVIAIKIRLLNIEQQLV